MGLPTKIDNQNALLYTFEREKLFDFNYHLKTQPHLASWINVQIRLNQDISTTTFEQFNRNIYVRLIGTEEFCNQVHCNPYYYRSQNCSPINKPIIFKSGNSDVFACQNSCFNIYNGAKDEDDNLYKAPFVMFNKSQNCCSIHNDAFFRMGIDDSIRSDVPTPRITTIGTGFDLSDEPYRDAAGNETFKFNLNKFYCDDFKYKFTDGECKASTSEWLFSILGSEILYKSIQYGSRKISSGIGLNDVNRPDLPTVSPENLKKIKTFDEWISHVNVNAHFFNINLTLKDLGITSETRHLIFTTEYGWPGRLVEPLIVYKTINPNAPIDDPISIYKIVDYSVGSKLLPQFRYDEYGRRESDEYDLIGSYDMLRKLNESMVGKFDDPFDVQSFMFLELLEAIKEFLSGDAATLSLTIGATFLNEISSALIKLFKFGQEKFIKVTTNMIGIAQRTAFSNIIKASGFQALKLGTRLFKFAISSLKMLTVVGMILDVVGLIDLFFLGSDVFGQNNLRDKSFTESYSKADLTMLEQVYGYKTVEFSPAYYFELFKALNYKKMPDRKSQYINLLKDEGTPDLVYSTSVDLINYDNLLKHQFFWQTEFLLSLEKNSDNIKIDWGDEVENIQFDAFIDGLKAPPRSYDGYSNYTQRFTKRKKNVGIFIIISVILLLIGLIMTFFRPNLTSTGNESNGSNGNDLEISENLNVKNDLNNQYTTIINTLLGSSLIASMATFYFTFNPQKNE